MLTIIKDLVVKSVGNFINSSGIKRQLVAGIAFVLDLTRLFPGAGEYVLVLEQINGALGIGAVGHATAAGTLSKEKIAGVVAVLYGLIFLSTWIPALSAALPFLYKAAATLSVARLGIALAK